MPAGRGGRSDLPWQQIRGLPAQVAAGGLLCGQDAADACGLLVAVPVRIAYRSLSPAGVL